MEKLLSKVKKIHLIGIGGVGMSGLALLLQDKGFLVQGSDICQTAKTEMLEKRGIKVYFGHKKANIDSKVDLICYSSAVSLDNRELEEAKNKGIQIMQRGKLLACLCKDTKTIAVAGSHGKTTIVSLLSYIFKKIGYTPTLFVGGLPVDGSLSAVWGRDYSIIETDESDGTFLDYQPYISVITNIDKEHLNYYGSFANLKKSFLSFAEKTNEKVFGCGDQKEVKEIVDKVGGVSYGLDSGCYLTAKNISSDKKFSYFDLYKGKKLCFSVKSPLLGMHNCCNLLAVLAIFDYLKLDLKKIKNYLVDFKGTERRFQIKANIYGVTFIDDYAHHPTEIRATLEAAKTLSAKRLVAILQPHRPSRVKLLFKEFSSCLEQADLVLVTDTYRASEPYLEEVNSFKLVEAIKNRGYKTINYLKKDKLRLKVPKMLREGDLVVSLGAGDINKQLEGIIDEFKKNKTETKC
ncbi:MAG: UDP-N-acetylmuramate--L-alanine ligase [Candidatus Omnitrophica bacterium]|nr:UDP-N-acetylmuramate--L-alanine ligase [Candidatus Omnitrophota bacterium]MCF7893593.1 UDP-N-acetylmuramate--L-alanine ligase [Candidatus Omnitrophota bacterium]